MEFITALDHSSPLLWLPPYHPQVQDVSMGSSDFLSDTQVDPRMVERWIGNPIYLVPLRRASAGCWDPVLSKK